MPGKELRLRRPLTPHWEPFGAKFPPTATCSGATEPSCAADRGRCLPDEGRGGGRPQQVPRRVPRRQGAANKDAVGGARDGRAGNGGMRSVGCCSDMEDHQCILDPNAQSPPGLVAWYVASWGQDII